MTNRRWGRALIWTAIAVVLVAALGTGTKYYLEQRARGLVAEMLGTSPKDLPVYPFTAAPPRTGTDVPISRLGTVEVSRVKSPATTPVAAEATATESPSPKPTAEGRGSSTAVTPYLPTPIIGSVAVPAAEPTPSSPIPIEPEINPTAPPAPASPPLTPGIDSTTVDESKVPELVILSMSVTPASPARGQSFVAALSGANVGSATARGIRVCVSLQREAAMGRWVPLASMCGAVEELGPGEQISMQRPVTVPPDAPTGNYLVTVSVEPDPATSGETAGATSSLVFVVN